ncbi:MAG: hypothetical protein ACXV5S_13750, partial [Acidimicrobiales bacterium]
VALLGLAALMTVVVALLAVEANRRTRRNRAMPRAAKRFGMAYSDVDRFNTTAVAFPLFRVGDGRVVENLMWHDDGSPSPTRVFDYSYYSSHRRTTGLGFGLGFGLVNDIDADADPVASIGETRTWHAFTCALAQHNGAWPAIRIAKEGIVDKAFQMVGLPDIDFESEEFNRMFVVQCADRRFASALIDPLMMDLLISTKGEITFETKGRFLLLSTHRIDPLEMPALLNLADEFVRRVPPAVRELYESFPDGAGTDVFPPAGGGTAPIAAGPGSWMGSGDPTRSLLDDDQSWDPTPGVDHDLDGHVVDPAVEDPWHDRPI